MGPVACLQVKGRMLRLGAMFTSLALADMSRLRCYSWLRKFEDAEVVKAGGLHFWLLIVAKSFLVSLSLFFSRRDRFREALLPLSDLS